MKSAFVLAAPHSGAGKTTVTLALLAALKARGPAVQAFKCGPDYIDPLHHAKVTLRPSHNLDTWMLGNEEVKRIFHARSQDADVSVVEGVMGLFDGASGVAPEGSTGDLAATLGLPVVLIIDARSMARSAAALVKGFVEFDPALKIAGIIWNRVGSPSHRRILDEACTQANLPPVLGCFHRDETLSLGERHLGLVTPDDANLPPHWVAHLARTAEKAVEIDLLLALTASNDPAQGRTAPATKTTGTIAVARDRAFCFYYEENFTMLEELGAKLLFFSPAEGDRVPEEADSLYLGGGYPELHAERLSRNEAFLDSIRAHHALQKPIYAECGGFMTLCRSIAVDGRATPMAGLFPADTVMGSKMARLGYREVSGVCGGVAGLTARGHEFHYSTVREMPLSVPRAFCLRNARGEELEPEGYLAGSALGGYVHLHFRSNPRMVQALFRL